MGDILDVNPNGRVVEGGINIINRDWVVGVGSVARDIAHDAEVPVGNVQAGQVDKVGDLLGEVNAVDKDVRLDNLGEGSALSGLRHIPLENVLLRDAGLDEEVNGTTSTAAKGTNNESAGLTPGNLLYRLVRYFSGAIGKIYLLPSSRISLQWLINASSLG